MKALICVAVIALTLFHFWASHKSPRRWYLGGIVPLIWAGTLAFLFARGSIVLGRDWATSRKADKKRKTRGGEASLLPRALCHSSSSSNSTASRYLA